MLDLQIRPMAENPICHVIAALASCIKGAADDAEPHVNHDASWCVDYVVREAVRGRLAVVAAGPDIKSYVEASPENQSTFLACVVSVAISKYLGLEHQSIDYAEAHLRIDQMKRDAVELLENGDADEVMALETILVIYHGHIRPDNASVVVLAMILIAEAAMRLHEFLSGPVPDSVGELSILGSVLAAAISAHLEVAAENGHDRASAMCFSSSMLDATKPVMRNSSPLVYTPKVLH